jgi:hypothetical protein
VTETLGRVQAELEAVTGRVSDHSTQLLRLGGSLQDVGEVAMDNKESLDRVRTALVCLETLR